MTKPASATRREIVVEGLLKFRSTGAEKFLYGDNGYYGYNERDAVSNRIFESASAQKFAISLVFDGGDEPISQLWKKIEESGYVTPTKIVNGENSFTKNSERIIWNDHEEVVVIENNKSSNKNSIKLNETLISHANTYYGSPITFNITGVDSGDPKQPCQTIEDNKGIQISFQRAPRMPDDNKLHQLPGSLGSYDLFNVEAHSDRLPENIKKNGGVFFPMWQREAMWLRFRSDRYQQCAVRVFVGHINAISGLRMDEDPSECSIDVPQDYVVIPRQAWLDGICVAPGVVRQFVAMPLGSGYTVEGQKTAEEKHGGMQIEITPQYDIGLRFWTRDNDEHIDFSVNGWTTIYRCHVGDTLRSYPQNPTRKRPFRLKDLLGEHAKVTFTAYYPLLSPAMMWSRNIEFPIPPLARYIQGRERSSSDYHGVVSNSCTNGVPALYGSPVVHYRNGSGSDAEKRSAKESPQTLEVGNETKKLKTMGVAAGGKLIQDIYKDPCPATIWNHAAAHIINVYILDPVSFEKITHIVPKPPPIDAKTYAEKGGQFFVVEEEVDQRLEGGDFDNVKSVSQMDKHVGVTTEPEFDPTKPKICTTCEVRLCDCIIRPCDHQFCNVCIKKLELERDEDPVLTRKNWRCPTCNKGVARVAGFSGPMNLPGEEPIRLKVPVHVLKIEDGRLRFSSLQRTRI